MPAVPVGHRLTDGVPVAGQPGNWLGAHYVDPEWMQRKLRRAAYAVWDALLDMRATDATCRVTAQALADTLRTKPSLTLWQVRTAFYRLEELGLLVVTQRVNQSFNAPTGPKRYQHVTRRIIGGRATRPLDHVPCFSIPGDVFEALERAGSGGPRKQTPKHGGEQTAKHAVGANRQAWSDERAHQTTKHGPGVAANQTTKHGGEQTTKQKHLLTAYGEGGITPSTKSAPQQPARVSELEHPPGSDQWVDALLTGPRPPQRVVPTFTLGQHRAAGLRIPPDPVDLLPKVDLPRPLPLEQEWSKARCAEELRRAYLSCVTARFKKRPLGFPSAAQLQGWKHYGILTHAVAIMRAENIAPIPWVGFQFDRWASMGKEGPPPVGFAFGGGSFVNLDWFRKEADKYVLRMPQIPEVVQLRQRHQHLLTRLRLTPPEHAQALLDAILPPSLYEQLLENAKRRANALRAELNLRIARGEWVWR